MIDDVPPTAERRLTELQAEVDRLRGELTAARAKAREDAAGILAAAQHRVRNMLAVVRAIVSRTAQPGAAVEDFAAHLIGRVNALVRLHGALTRSPTGTVDLEEIIREEFLAQGGLVPGQIAIEGPSIALPGKAAEVLGLAIHELAANSIKFGALATDSGHVEVGWSVLQGVEPPKLSILWTEAGAPLDRSGRSRGFGQELIEDGLPYQLGAETAFELRHDGFLCSIVMAIGTAGSSTWAVAPNRPES